MEKFFKPVHSPSGPDEIKPRKHHHHQQDPQSHRYTVFDDTDESHGRHHHHHHGRYLHDIPHHSDHRRHQTHHSEEDEILYEHETPVTLSRASSSSLSSSSSSSFSSWYTEESANDPFSLHRVEQPQHSLSCSNIADVRGGFREDDGSEPIVFATIKHGKNSSEGAQKRGKHGFASLDRGHSRSEEGLVQGNQSDVGGEPSRTPRINCGPLYKAASLNRSLAFSEEDFLLGVSKGPKRAVSSSQLPSKGILKNKEPHTDIRKAKSMEVISPRVSKGAQDPSGQKGKGTTQVNTEQARSDFVQGKLQFSAFLDEITKQVISPSALTILGVNSDKTSGKTPAPAQTPDPVKPQLPPKKHRESSVEEREQQPRQHKRQEKAARKHSDCSNPDKLVSYAARNHHGSPPPHHSHSQKDRRPSPPGSSMAGDRYGRCGPHVTDGTGTSPKHSQPKHHRKQEPTASHSQHTQHFPQQVHPSPGLRRPVGSPPSTQGVGPGSESSSTKSDSPMARDTASTATSHSSEHSGRHQHVGQHRDTLCDADLLRVLQEENTDLHQNLLQTVVCIESLEAELQRTRDELSHVKEKYQSLLETHTGTKQTNNLLGEHLHIASESLASERKYLLNRVSQLSSELEDANRTIAALENINVPCLIKELLEKHFNSAEAIQKFLTTVSHPATSPQAESQSKALKVEEESRDWLKSEAGPQRVTAFIPFKHGAPTPGSEGSLTGLHESSTSFSVSDISSAISKRMAASYAARPQPVHPQSQQHTDNPPHLQQAHVGSDSWDGGKGGVKVTLLEQDVVDATPNSVSAQRILDDFLQQLQPYKEAGGGQEQHGGQQW